MAQRPTGGQAPNPFTRSPAAGVPPQKSSKPTVTGATSKPATGAALVSIAVTPANATIGVTVQQYTAIGTYSDLTTADLTGSAQWTSSDTSVATIAAGGLATGIAPGSITIKATDPLSGINGSTGLSVTAPVIPLSPVIVFDASQASLIQRAGAVAPDGEFVDAWNTVAVQATTTLQPTVDLYALGGPCIWWGGHARPDIEPAPFVTALVAPSVGVAIPCTFLVFGTFNNSLVNGTVHCWELGNTSTGVGVLFDALGSIKVVGLSGTLTGAVTWTITDNAQHDIAITITSTTISVELDGVSLTVTPTGTSPGAGSIAGNLTLGADHSVVDTSMWMGHVGFWGVWNRALTTVEKSDWRSYLLINWYRGSTTATLVHKHIQCGDSIADGDQCAATNGGINPQYAHGYKLTQYLGSAFGTFANESEGGARLTIGGSVGSALNVLSQWTTFGSSAIVNGIDNVVRIQGGINDAIALAPSSSPSAITDAATIVGYISTVVNQVTSDLSGHAHGPNGHIVRVSTMTAYTTSGAPFQNQCRGLVNTNTLASYNGVTINGVKVFVDPICNDPVIGQDSFGRVGIDYPHFNYTTGPHPSQIGQSRWAGLEVIAYRQLRLAAGTVTSVVVTPAAGTAYVGIARQYTAIAIFSDGPPLDVTSVAAWDTTNHAFATIASTGLLTPLSSGGITVTAVFGGVTGSTGATISAATPATILGSALTAWYRSDLGITQGGGTVSAWADQSGNGHTLTAGASQPGYVANSGVNNRPYLLFGNQTTEALVATTFANPQPFEYFVVVRPLSAAPGSFAYVIDFCALPAGPGNVCVLLNPNSNTLQLFPGPTTASVSLTDHIVDCICNGASSSIAVDEGTPVAGTIGGTNPSGLTIGNVGAGGGTQSNPMFVYEVIIANAPVVGATRTSLLAYLTATA